MSLSLSASGFLDNGEMPSRLTCDDQDLSPALSWKGIPANAKSLALIVDDPDAPDPAAPQRTWVHWLLYNIPPASSGLPEGAPATALPPGTRQGLNDWHRQSYGGPCPPIGRHRYFFKLYALDTVLPELATPDKNHLEEAMQGHIIEKTQIIGLYQRT